MSSGFGPCRVCGHYYCKVHYNMNPLYGTNAFGAHGGIGANVVDCNCKGHLGVPKKYEELQQKMEEEIRVGYGRIKKDYDPEINSINMQQEEDEIRHEYKTQYAYCDFSDDLLMPALTEALLKCHEHKALLVVRNFDRFVNFYTDIIARGYKVMSARVSLGTGEQGCVLVEVCNAYTDKFPNQFDNFKSV